MRECALKNARTRGFGELLGEEKKRAVKAFQGCRGHTWTRYARFSVGSDSFIVIDRIWLPIPFLCFVPSEVDAGQWGSFVAPFSQGIRANKGFL